MINSQLKMVDIVFDNPRILLVLEHFNVSLGFGEQTVREMCEIQGVDEYLFLTIANLYCCKENVTLDTRQFDITAARQILTFLKTSHTYFLDEKIPNLKSHIEKRISQSPEEKYSRLIKKFIHDYSNEVTDHIHYENTVVFPYIESLLDKKEMEYRIEKFKKHNIEDKLTDLKNLLIQHLPPEYDSVVRRRMLFELYDLEHDINIHDFIENHLLIPVVERLELEMDQDGAE